MPDRTPWTCPNCQRTYAVPSTAGLTVCPECAAAMPARRSYPYWVFAIPAGLLVGFTLLAIASSRQPEKPTEKPKPVAAAAKPAPQPNPVDEDLELVRQWLRENLDSGKWEEVLWWPAVRLTDLHEVRLKSALHDLDDHQKEFDDAEAKIEVLENQGVDVGEWSLGRRPPLGMTPKQNQLWNLYRQSHDAKQMRDALQHRVDILQERGPRRICGLRFRTRNRSRTMELIDTVFDITNGQAVPVDPLTEKAIVEGTDRGWAYLENPGMQPQAAPRNELNDVAKGIIDDIENGKRKKK